MYDSLRKSCSIKFATIMNRLFVSFYIQTLHKQITQFDHNNEFLFTSEAYNFFYCSYKFRVSLSIVISFTWLYSFFVDSLFFRYSRNIFNILLTICFLVWTPRDNWQSLNFPLSWISNFQFYLSFTAKQNIVLDTFVYLITKLTSSYQFCKKK